MAANVEMKTLISDRARNATDIHRVGFHDIDADFLLRQEVARGQTRRPGTDNGDFCLHFPLRDPISSREIPHVPALYA